MQEMSKKLEALRLENNPSKRNELALELSASGEAEVLSVIVELILRPGLENQRGTLVHCLKNFNYSSLFDLLIDLQLSGNWEVAHEAHELLINIDAVQDEPANTAYQKLLVELKKTSLESWREAQIKQLLEMFE